MNGEAQDLSDEILKKFWMAMNEEAQKLPYKILKNFNDDERSKA